MIKKKSRINKLIVRKNLLKEIKNKNIPKATPEAVNLFIEEIEFFISNSLIQIKENMDISARKTMKKEDVIEAAKQKIEEFDL